MSEGDPKIHCAVCGTDLVIGAVVYDEEDENKPVEWGVCPCPNCATTSPQEAARAAEEIQLRLKETLDGPTDSWLESEAARDWFKTIITKHFVKGHDRGEVSQSAREAQLDGLEICLRDLNNPDIAENAERRATTVNEGLRLLSRVTAALSATRSGPAILVATALERIVEVATAGAKQTNDADAKERFEWIRQRASSSPSVAGGEPAHPMGLYSCNTPAQGFNAERERKVRAELLRQVKEAVKAERLHENLDNEGDKGHMNGINDSLAAIDRIAAERGIEIDV